MKITRVETDLLRLPLPRPEDYAEPNTRWTDQFRYPRSLIVSWFGDLGAQTGVYGVTL